MVRACLDWLALHRIKAWRRNNTGIFDPIKMIHRRFRGLRGVSDILGILPRTVWLAEDSEETFGNFLAIDVKKPGKSRARSRRCFGKTSALTAASPCAFIRFASWRSSKGLSSEPAA